MLLELLRDAFPHLTSLPSFADEAKKLTKDLFVTHPFKVSKCCLCKIKLMSVLESFDSLGQLLLTSMAHTCPQHHRLLVHYIMIIHDFCSNDARQTSLSGTVSGSAKMLKECA